MAKKNGGTNMLTNKDYCDYDTSITLGELGFPLKRMKVKNFIGGQFHDSIVTVLLYEAQKWLREEKQIEIVVHSFDYVGEPYFADIHMYREVRCACNYATSYEEALSEGIKEAVKILKENYE